MKTRVLLPTLFLLLACPLLAQTPDPLPDWTTFLVPVYNLQDVPGGFGSLWRTEFWIRNNGSEGHAIEPIECAVLCPPLRLQPNFNLFELPTEALASSTNPGRLYHVESSGAADVSASARLWDVSREADDAGTEIPIISESELLSSTAHLTAIPLDGRFRLMLRIYDVLHAQARFRVRVYGMEPGEGAPAPLMQFDLTAMTNDTRTFRGRPAYAQHSGIESLLLLPMPMPPHLRIEVEPLTPGSLFWTFVAITNNVTQRVTLVTPQ